MKNMASPWFRAAFCGLLLSGSQLMAAEAEPEVALQTGAQQPSVLDTITVIGRPDRAREVQGSATVLTAETLSQSHVLTTNEALRKVPGVNVRDEEGLGLRPNIGIRGLNPTRSTKVLLLEDGLPVTYAPYGANESYYHPPIDRFQRVEVLKGALVNAYGPQTLSGVVNYLTPNPPQEFTGRIGASGGSREYFNAHLRLGGKGMLFDYVRKQGDAARDHQRSELDDFNFKAVTELSPSHSLIARASHYIENSDVSYSGITDAEFANFGAEYNPFSNDTFDAHRSGGSLTHDWDMGERGSLTTSVYLAAFSRDWWRQSSTTSDGQCGTQFTADRRAGIAVDADTCNSAQGRLRDYRTYGIEPRYRLKHALFGLDNELQVSARAHFEAQYRLQENGTTAGARSGTRVEDNERYVDAYSAFVQNRFDFGRLSLTPNLRIEEIEFERRNQLTGERGDDSVSEVLPGLAAGFELSKDALLYASVYRGFAPPRVEDLISNTGTSAEVDAEESVNAEVGLRMQVREGVQFETSIFRNDYSNLIAVGSIAGGSTPLAQGDVLIEGAELNGRADFGRILGSTHNPFVELAYTVLPTAEVESAFERVDNGMPANGSEEGKRLPYAPRHLFTSTLGYQHPLGIELRLEAVYIANQFSDFANTEDPDGSGQVGRISSSTVWNAAANYSLAQTGLSLFVTAKNLGDKEYIVDRTRGIQTGLPRLVQAGLSYRF